MATRPTSASRAGRGGRDEQHPGSDGDVLGQVLDQALSAEAKRMKRRRNARELAKAIPDAIDALDVLDLVLNLWP